jgi:hypothetical protein
MYSHYEFIFYMSYYEIVNTFRQPVPQLPLLSQLQQASHIHTYGHLLFRLGQEKPDPHLGRVPLGHHVRCRYCAASVFGGALQQLWQLAHSNPTSTSCSQVSNTWSPTSSSALLEALRLAHCSFHRCK